MQDQQTVAAPGKPETAQNPTESHAESLTFSGRAGEYFRIWIVNLLLSLLSLGIYSAWAKVRRKQYFLGNTQFAGRPFNYLANPVSILKGRLLVAPFFLSYIVISNVWPQYSLLFWLVLLPVLPWVVIKALRFNAINSEYSGIRFGFQAPYSAAATTYALTPMLVILTLGLISPYFIFRQRRFFLKNSRFGQLKFTFDGKLGEFYGYAIAAFGILVISGGVAAFLIAIMIGATAITQTGFAAAENSTLYAMMITGVASLIVIMITYLFAWCFYHVQVNRYAWAHTQIENIKFRCEWTTFNLFAIYLTNAMAISLSVGLLIPWARIRTARYKIERMSLLTDSDFANFKALAARHEQGAGDAAAEMLDMDLGL